jgi:hypothetical protein
MELLIMSNNSFGLINGNGISFAEEHNNDLAFVHQRVSI